MKVFWSWQSDHSGEISRHLVRDALQEAIEALNTTPEISEPDRPEVSLDHDRKDIPGSPDLANVILQKIGECSVFVADVTPVGQCPGRRSKKLMNPNVAIELGYALAKVTDRGVLMVMNEHFGKIEDLPFDLRHKAGPVTYSLAPGASKAVIGQERIALVGKLKVALRAILKSASAQVKPAAPFTAERSLEGDASRFLEGGKTLAMRESTWRGQESYTMPRSPLLYLRLIPTQELSRLTRANAVGLTRGGEPSLEPLSDSFESRSVIANEQGVVSFSSNQDGEVLFASQLFLNREIWGFDAVLTEDAKGLPTLAIERTLAAGLRNYLRFATEKLDLRPPFDVEGGATRVKGYPLLMRRGKWGPILQDSFVWKGRLQTLQPTDVDNVLLNIFSALYDAGGATRPEGLYNFPGVQGGALPNDLQR